MKKNKVLILTGGTIKETFLTAFLEREKPDQIICVDGALGIADKLKIPMDYIVGDFDTVSKELIESYKRKIDLSEISTQIREFCPEKDETDTQIALSLALEMKADEICIIGATGSRMDHQLANIHLLIQPMRCGIKAYIADTNNHIYLKNHSFKVKKSDLKGKYFSLIPFEKGINQVTIKGFKYNTNQVDFPMGSSIGVSNELVLEEGTVDFKEGTFLVIESND